MLRVHNNFLDKMYCAKSKRYLYVDLVKNIFVMPIHKVEAWQQCTDMENFEWKSNFLIFFLLKFGYMLNLENVAVVKYVMRPLTNLFYECTFCTYTKILFNNLYNI